MSKNPLNEINLGQTTEACPQMRRRFRAGVAADFTVWLIMLRGQYSAQLGMIPPALDDATDKYRRGMVRYLNSMVEMCNALAARVVDRFSVHEWNASVETFANAVDLSTGTVDSACAAVAQELDNPERESESDE